MHSFGVAVILAVGLLHFGACDLSPIPECNWSCPEEYKPVCAVVNMQFRTIKNQCVFDKENACEFRKYQLYGDDASLNYRKLHDGECEADGEEFNSGEYKRPIPECNWSCPEEYKPVCAVVNMQFRTIKNQCVFDKENACEFRKYQLYGDDASLNYRKLHDGECEADGEEFNSGEYKRPIPECNWSCPEQYKPVCAVVNMQFRTIKNQCVFDKENACEFRKYQLYGDDGSSTYRKLHNGQCDFADGEEFNSGEYKGPYEPYKKL